jgi:hypothetical protein
MKKEIAFNLDPLTQQPLDLSIIGSAGGGLVQDAESPGRKRGGAVSEYGYLVIDGKLIKPCHLDAVERTERNARNAHCQRNPCYDHLIADEKMQVIIGPSAV